MNQHHLKKEKVFKIFKWNLVHDEALKQELKKEMNHFSMVLLNKFKNADGNSNDMAA